jgi:hypothetical protein
LFLGLIFTISAGAAFNLPNISPLAAIFHVFLVLTAAVNLHALRRYERMRAIHYLITAETVSLLWIVLGGLLLPKLLSDAMSIFILVVTGAPFVAAIPALIGWVISTLLRR